MVTLPTTIFPNHSIIMTKFGFSTFFFAACLIASTCAGGLNGNCDDNFLNMDRFDLCEGGIENVLLSDDGGSLPCTTIGKSVCSPYDCCGKAIMGSCLDNFLYLEKEYLCNEGVKGVRDTWCVLASDGACERVDCCDDWEYETTSDFSYSMN